MKVDYLTDDKLHSMKKAVDGGGQYYPTDTGGVIDEWAALAMQQDNYWRLKMEQDKIDKRLRQKQYLDDLDQQRRMKGTHLHFINY